MIRLLLIVIGYFFGCIQFAYIAGKLTKHIDIREHGSGNSGTSNAIRVLGFSAGALVFVGDLLKALAACFIGFALAKWFAPESYDIFEMRLSLGMYAGLGAVLGHNFPVFLKFKGGKGIASSLGVMAAIDWRIFLIAVVVGVIIIVCTRYISLGSIIMLVLFPALTFVFKHGPEIGVISLFLTGMALVRHRENIERLMNRTERKLTFNKPEAL
jgi:glycerol-3-phosphate acyltransferase PlsY